MKRLGWILSLSLLFFLVMCLGRSQRDVEAGVPENLPVIDDVALQKFLRSMADHLNTLECLTADPNGSVLGTHGELKCGNFGGSHYICMNTSSGPNKGTGWTCINVSIRHACAIVEDLANNDDNFPLGSVDEAITVTQLWCTCSGTCTSVAQLSFEDGSGNAMTHTTPTCTAIGTIPTAQSVTSGGGLTARESLRFDVTNTPNPETDTYEICWSFRAN